MGHISQMGQCQIVSLPNCCCVCDLYDFFDLLTRITERTRVRRNGS